MQRPGGVDLFPAAFGHLAEEEFAHGGTMQGHVTADRKLQAQWPMRFDPVEINNLVAVEDAEIAGLSGFLGKRLQHRMARRALRRMRTFAE